MGLAGPGPLLNLPLQPSSSPEEYFRISLYNEFLSHIISELENRFVNNPAHDIALGLLYLSPNECLNLKDDKLPPELVKVIQIYEEDLPHSVMM